MFAVRAATAAALMFGLAAEARAGDLYNNLGVATASFEGVAANGPLYNSFTTNSSGLVNKVALLLDLLGPPNQFGFIDVAIYAAASADKSSGSRSQYIYSSRVHNRLGESWR